MAAPSASSPSRGAPPSPVPIPAEPRAEAQRTVELRDIHLPDGVSPWPPGPGGWVLMALALLAGLAAWLWRRHRRGPNLAVTARAELDAALAVSGELERAERMVLLLRRVALSHPAGASYRADASGAWLAWLADQTGQPAPSPEITRAVTDALYRRNAGRFEDIAALTEFASAIVGALPRRWQSGRRGAREVAAALEPGRG